MSPVPDFLTVEEAGRVLRIGRTKAYAMGQEWRATKGESGIKVCEIGGQLRVPKVWLEAQLEAPLMVIPAPSSRGGRNGHDRMPQPRPPAPEPSSTAATPPTPPTKRRRRTRRETNQLTLPFG